MFSKKKLGIITVSRTNNYGAELQAFALQKKLQLLGHQAEIIDYLYYKHKNYKQTKESMPLVGLAKKEKIKKYFLYRVVTPLLENVISCFYGPLKRRLRNFEQFHTHNVFFSKQFRSLTELQNGKLDYDGFIVGSDQVWNPTTATSLSPYFLEFAPKDKLKFSYASSFGVSAIDKRYYPLYKKYLANLDAISVRENDGVCLVKGISGREALRVLDPTLLLAKEEWLTVVSKPQKLPLKYLVIYQLHESNTIFDLAYRIAKMLNLEIILISKRAFLNKKYKDIVNVTDAGPSEFVELFSKASFVITNSFHGTAFSVNFNVPFFTVLNPEKKNNSRMVDFLKINGLDKRILFEKDNLEELISNYEMCDFQYSNTILNTERFKSVEFLVSNIKKV